MPLAPLTDVSANGLPAVVKQMETRINALGTAAEKAQLWEATSLLMGLKYAKPFVAKILEGVMFDLKESSVYQAAVKEGLEEGLAKGELLNERRVILRQGHKRFGEPNTQIITALETINSLEQLEKLEIRISEVESWDELLS